MTFDSCFGSMGMTAPGKVDARSPALGLPVEGRIPLHVMGDVGYGHIEEKTLSCLFDKDRIVEVLGEFAVYGDVVRVPQVYPASMVMSSPVCLASASTFLGNLRREAVLVGDELGDLLYVVQRLEHLDNCTPGLPSSGNRVTFAATRSPSALDAAFPGSTMKWAEILSSSGTRKRSPCARCRKPVMFFVFLSVTLRCGLPSCPRRVLDPHDDLVAVEGVLDEAGGTKMSFSPPLSGTTKPLPLLVHKRVPTSRFISSGMPNRSFLSLTREPSLAISQEALDLPLPALPGVDHALEVIDRRGRSCRLNTSRRSRFVRSIGRLFFIGPSWKDTPSRIYPLIAFIIL